MTITGRTQLAGVVGSPIAHSLSPALHNAGFRSTGVDAVYVAFEVVPKNFPSFVSVAAQDGFLGLSVTMPHKASAASLSHQVSDVAVGLRSVNTLSFDRSSVDVKVLGDSTDGDGLVSSLRDEGVDVSGRSVAVIGAGGAGRAVVDAMRRHQARSVTVVNRTLETAQEAASLGPIGSLSIGLSDNDLPDFIATCEILVNCSSVGMGASGERGESPIPENLIRRDLVVVDLVYHPMETPLLKSAKRAGALCVGGLGMLAHQAALQQLIWTGHRPDIEAMKSVAQQALDEHR